MRIENDKSNNIESAIKINSIGKSFASRLVLDNIDLCVIKGQSLCLCGANGAGKSTLLRIISGLLEPDRGYVELNGYNLKENPEKAKIQLGVVSHKSMVYSDLTVIENILFFAAIYAVKDSLSHAEQLIKDIGLEPYRYDRASILSRGLLQRLAIARALMHKPTILLLDEPFTGLDVEAVKHLIAVLSDFTDNNGTIIMTTHDINVGIQSCDRVAVLDKNRIIFDEMICDIDTNSFKVDYLSYARGSN